MVHFYYFIQVATLLILLLAANTSFADFPRLCYFLARDGFCPRQLSLLGDRLVYSNGIILLSLCAAVLVIILGQVNAIILYAVGVRHLPVPSWDGTPLVQRADIRLAG